MPSYFNGLYHIGQDIQANVGDDVYPISDGNALQVISVGDGGHKRRLACGVFADYGEPPCSASACHRFTCSGCL